MKVNCSQLKVSTFSLDQFAHKISQNDFTRKLFENIILTFFSAVQM